MKTMTKKERRQNQLNAHYAALVRLAEACGVKKADGKKLSVKLLIIERQTHKGAEAYCNGVRFEAFIGGLPEDFDFSDDENAWERFSDKVVTQVQALFNSKLPYLHINGDARGYALKIRGSEAGNDYGRELIEKTGLQRDWGGNGLLAPEITGN